MMQKKSPSRKKKKIYRTNPIGKLDKTGSTERASCSGRELTETPTANYNASKQTGIFDTLCLRMKSDCRSLLVEYMTIQYRFVTVGQPDRRTDRQKHGDSKYLASAASCGKNN